MIAARIALLNARIAAREGKPGYKRNVMALKVELTRLTKMLSDNPTADPQETVGGDLTAQDNAA